MQEDILIPTYRNHFLWSVGLDDTQRLIAPINSTQYTSTAIFDLFVFSYVSRHCMIESILPEARLLG